MKTTILAAIATLLALSVSAPAAEVQKKIAFISGGASHGYMSHEHYAGNMLLAKALQEAYPGLQATVSKGWPQEKGALDGADAIVLFSDGGGGNPIIPHLDELEPLMKKGVGLSLLHYAVEVPKGKPGDCLKDWIGGYFEVFWSVNPTWTAEFKEFPKHPVANGLKPFSMNDEWYYHMRFRDNMQGVTSILKAVPPEGTRGTGTSERGGNDAVRARKGMAEDLLWVAERPDGGRGMGFTGGHFHWNWASKGFRTAVLNGIAWTAKLEIPADGVPSKPLSLADLKANMDKEEPKGYSFDEAERVIEANK